MPQHDFNIANQLFPPTRADLNNALQALVSNSSGPSAPASPVAAQWWADTTNNVMKFRDNTNDNWIELFRLDNGEIVQPVTIEAVPVGTIVAWPGLTAPDKWMLCHGQVLERLDYPGLFNVLGTRYNTGGETSSQFRLPDYRGRVAVGRDDMGGTAAGRVTVGVSGVAGNTIGATGGHQALQEHTHSTSSSVNITLNDPGHSHMLPGQTVKMGTSGWSGAASPFGYAGSNTLVSPTGITVASATVTVTNAHTGSGTGQNMMPCIVQNYIIFTGGLGAPGDGGGGTPESTFGPLEAVQFACTDETTAISTTGAKITLRWPYEFAPVSARISLNTACATGTFTVTATVNGNALFSTALTIDATEKTSKTAAVPAVLALDNIPDDAEVVVTVSDIGDGTATGLKFALYGYQVLS